MSTHRDRPDASSDACASLPGATPNEAVRNVSINAKLLPPNSLVEVPNFPPKIPAADAAAADPLPGADEQTESNWADGTQAQPLAKNARSSLL